MTKQHGTARSIGLRLLSSAAGLLVALLAAEAGLRVAGYSPAHVNPLKTFHVMDPVIGHRGRPGADARFRRPEFDIRIMHDDRGFRLPERPPDPARCTRRVLVYGDSFIWGWGVEQGELMTDRLSRLRPDLCVYNFSINATGTANQFTLFDTEHRDLVGAGDIVVVVFFSNDFADNVSGWSLRGRLVDGRVETVLTSKGLGSPAKQWVKNHSYLFNLGAYAWDSWHLRRQQRRDEARASSALDYGADSPEWIVTGHYLEAFRDAVEARGGTLLVTMVPTDLPADSDVYRSALRRLTDSLGIRFYDVADEFRAESMNNGTVLRYPVDGHWTAAGHALMARLLARELPAPAR